MDIVMPMYNLVEYIDKYSKASVSLWQYYRDETALNNGVIANPLANSASFSFKQKITGETGDDGGKDIEIIVSLKYLSNFQRTVVIPLVNCEINLVLTWSVNCVISNAEVNQATIFAIADTERQVPVVILPTDDNGKLLQQLKLGFKRTVNWNNYQSKGTMQAQN